jgi:transposase InsO family protein
VARLMREHRLNATPPRRFRVMTTNSNHEGPIAPNRLADGAEIPRPNPGWVGDITYGPTDEGWLYRAGILDAYSRRMMGWAMSDHVETARPLTALQMALKHRQPSSGALHPSDRGCP